MITLTKSIAETYTARQVAVVEKSRALDSLWIDQLTISGAPKQPRTLRVKFVPCNSATGEVSPMARHLSVRDLETLAAKDATLAAAIASLEEAVGALALANGLCADVAPIKVVADPPAKPAPEA